ncbi:hypothetical protein BJX66DRAFT_301342 [Aspergillus keveii]|uniref:Uncharacterized protein n=1 Tax=Aspergillus keveii TaxID=714993 RepID=A0ABR4G9V4_9EURO
MINTPPTTLMNLVFDAAAQGGCIEEIHNEVAGILAQDGNGWVDTSICKMKKLDSFVHESLRLSTFPVALTGWRVVICNNGFDFGDGLVLPRGSSFTFPTLNMRLDSDTFEQAEVFDGLRFCRMQKNNQNQNQNQECEGDGATTNTDKH